MTFNRVFLLSALVFLLVELAATRGFASTEYIYVTTSSGMLFQIHSTTYEIVSKVNVGGAPVALWGAREKLFIADHNKSVIRVYDPSKKKVIGQIGLGGVPCNRAVIWQDRWALLTLVEPRHALIKVDSKSKKVGREIHFVQDRKPCSLAIAPNGKLYLVDGYLEKIIVVDPSSMKLVEELSTKGRYANIQISRNGKAYLTGYNKDWSAGNWIDVWDTATNMFVDRLTNLVSREYFGDPVGEGFISQQEMIIADDLDRLISITYAPLSMEGSSKESRLLIGIALATHKVVWRVTQAHPQDWAHSLTLSLHGDVFVTANGHIKVINVVDGILKKSIPIRDAAGIASLAHK